MLRLTLFLAAHPRWTALIAGGVSATGFAPLGLWPVTLLMLALLLALVARAPRKRSAFALGWAFGVGHFAISLNWIATAFTFQAAMPAWLGWVAVVGLAMYLAIYPGLAAMAAWWGSRILQGPPRDGEVARAQRVTEGSVDGAHPSTTLRAVPLPVPGRYSLPFILLFAAAWVVTEWLRSWVFTGFAWNPLVATYSADFTPPLIQIFGTYGSSGVVALWAGIICFAWSRCQPDPSRSRSMSLWWRAGGVVAASWLLLIPVTAITSLSQSEIERGSTSTQVTIIQPNIEQGDKWDMAQRAENFRKLARLTRPPAPANDPMITLGQERDDGTMELAEVPRSMSHEPRLVLWPEAAVPDYLESGYPQDWYLEPASFARQRLAALLGPDDLLLTGAVRLEPNRDRTDILGARNSLFVLNARGELGPRYDKAHLVPGGEYLPLRAIAEPLGLSRLTPGAVDFWPGPGARTLDLSRQGFGRVGIQICYEIIFSGQVVDRANRPDFIFNPSNDAWFGSWGPPQHLAQARLRAIEEGLPVVRSTPTGISAIIAPDGRVLHSIPHGEAGRIDARLPLPREPTLFARYGNILPLLLAVFLVACAVAIGRRRR